MSSTSNTSSGPLCHEKEPSRVAGETPRHRRRSLRHAPRLRGSIDRIGEHGRGRRRSGRRGHRADLRCARAGSSLGRTTPDPFDGYSAGPSSRPGRGSRFPAGFSLGHRDVGTRELVFLDRDGSIRARSGRDGEGPGEYRWIERIGVGADGIPFVFDRRLRRFTFLNARGEVTRIQRLDQGAGLGAAVPLSRFENGEVLAALETRPILPPGLQRGPVFLVLSSDLGEIVDTLGEWAGKERYVTDEWLPVGFAQTALFAGRGRHALVGTNDSIDLTLYRGIDPVTRLRGGYFPRRVTAQEKEEWTERFLAMFPEDYRAGWRRRLERSTIRDFYPAFGAIKVDADGRIWIGDYPKLADELRRWTIIEPDGTPVAAVNLPVLFPPAPPLRRRFPRGPCRPCCGKRRIVRGHGCRRDGLGARLRGFRRRFRRPEPVVESRASEDLRSPRGSGGSDPAAARERRRAGLAGRGAPIVLTVLRREGVR